ncbi:MAG: DUF2914 domain-containing protein [Gemmatimonadetes bacterium]|nr:DUF2914 domain-containing protein [Gemmatimonadota bacterium]
MTAVTLSCVAAGRGLAQEQAGPVVMEAAVGTAVVDRELQGAAEMFPATVGTLYCFSRIGQTQAGTTIEHVWYFGDQEVARVELSIGGSPWRTWSSKTIPAEATGSWRVDIVANGNVLKSLAFTVQ